MSRAVLRYESVDPLVGPTTMTTLRLDASVG
jgi:hypothetical protein